MKLFSSVSLVAGLAAALLSVGLSPISARADDAPVTLKYVTKVGDSSHQQIEIKAMVSGVDAVVKQTQKRLVKEVKDSGETTTVITDEGGTLNLAGTDQHQDPVAEITVKRDKFGKLLDWKPAADIGGNLPPELLRTTEELYTIVLPDKAVKEKDTWKSEVDNPMLKAKKISVENTYLGLVKVGDVSLWKIKQTASVPTDDMGGVSMFDGTFWLDPATGKTVKIEGSMKDVPSQFGKLSFTVLVTEIKDAKPTTTTQPADAKAPK